MKILVLALSLSMWLVPALAEDEVCGPHTTPMPVALANVVLEQAFKVNEIDVKDQKNLRKIALSKGAGYFFCAQAEDLTGQGSQGYLISMSDVSENFGAGMHNQPVWVYERSGQGYRLLLESYGGYMNPVSILKESTHGYHNIRTYTHSSAIEHEITVFKYDGKQYQAAECMTETYNDKRDDRHPERFLYKHHKCENV